MAAILDILDALTGGAAGVFETLFEHLGGFLGSVGEVVVGSSTDVPVVEAPAAE